MESPERTRDRLLPLLQGRRPDIDRLTCYYRGDHPLPWAADEVRDAYRVFLRMARSNWCRLVVKATSERLRPVGIRFSEGDATGDVEAWTRYWQWNRLDAECRLVQDSALALRRGFVLVWPSLVEGAPPSITPEHPSQMYVEYAPGNRRVRTAALKVFCDPVAGVEFATLFTPGAVYNWRRNVPVAQAVGQYAMGHVSDWVPWESEADGIMAEAENPLGVVPVVEFVADPAMLGEPMSELDGGVTDIQDRINRTLLDRLVTANFASFPQRWVTGMEIPSDPDTGKDVEPFKAAVDRLWMAENPGVSFGQFDAASLEPYIKSVEADIQHLAAITRTPPHYLLGQSGAFPSGESLKSTETGLVAKVMERRDSFTESWEDVIRLALSADSDPRAEDMALSVLWKDPESRTLAELVDAAVKLNSIGVPWREVMAFVGYTPTEIDRLDAERALDAADAALLAPVPTLAPMPAATVPAA